MLEQTDPSPSPENPNLTQELDIYLARQPIFDKDLNLVAYELLYRKGDTLNAEIEDADDATMQVVLNVFTEMGLREMVGNNTAYINLTRNLILMPLPIPKDRVVLEILEDVEADEEVIEGLKRLSNEGYTLALDDFELSEKNKELIQYAKIIKVDVGGRSKEELRDYVKILEQYDVTLLAEKVETHEEFDFCKELGFQHFQGYFLSKPKVVKGKRATPDSLIVTQLIGELCKPDNDMNKIEELLAKDPKLSFKLLQIINSAAYAKAKKIESLHQAIVYMGLSKLRAWASLIALNSVQCRSPEIKKTAMVRAKMAELLACKAGDQKRADKYFITGLFSMLDTLLDEDLITLLGKVNLEEEISDALLKRLGDMGSTLEDVIYYEQAKWDSLSKRNLESTAYREAYLESIKWSEAVMDTLN